MVDKVHLPIQRKSRLGRAPWGYVEAEPGSPTLLPVKELLDVLEKGLDYCAEGASYDKVAAYITEKSGKSITPITVRTYFLSDPNREADRERRAKLTSNYTENHPTKRKRKDEETRVRLGIGNVQKSLTFKKKKLARLQAEKSEAKRALSAKIQAELPTPVETAVEETVPAEAKEHVAQVDPFKIIPNPGPQTDFLAASEKEVLFGGQAGGGKSFAINIDPLRTVHLASHKAITFRRTNDELRELIWQSKELYPKVIPGAKFQEQKSTWTFPNGASHWFRYLDRDDDVLSMQGQAFTWVGFDELTQWPTPFVYDYMRSRLRTTDPEIAPYLGVRSTTNPGNSGHQWVKKMYIDPAPPNTAFPARDLESGEVLVYPPGHSRAGEPLFYRKFIPSKLSDNPYLTRDGQYEANLLSLNEVQRRQLLEGDWDIVQGAAFSEFKRSVHVYTPFDIPSHWVRFRAMDWGYEQPHCVLWFAIEPDTRRIFVYREVYGKRVDSPDLADKVLSLEAGEHISYGVLDSHAWDVRDGGVSPARNMISRGCFWRPAANRSPNSRVTTKSEIHRRLKIGEHYNANTRLLEVRSNLVIFDTCVNLIRTLPALQVDKTKPEDVDTDMEDHAYDALRYGLASKPMYQQLAGGSTTHFSPVPARTYDNFGFPQ